MTTAICLFLGFPLAYVLARTQTRYKNLLLIGVVIPLFVGNAVRAAGWMTLFGSRGFLSVGLMDLGITSTPTEIMFTERRGDHRDHRGQPALYGADAAKRAGGDQPEPRGGRLQPRRAARWRCCVACWWPMALPGITAGTILTFILAMNAYATPVLLGGPEFKMMAPLVYGQFQLNNWPFAAAVAFILMSTTLALTVAAGLATRQSFRD